MNLTNNLNVKLNTKQKMEINSNVDIRPFLKEQKIFIKSFSLDEYNNNFNVVASIDDMNILEETLKNTFTDVEVCLVTMDDSIGHACSIECF